MPADYPTSAASFPTRVNGNTIPPLDHNAPCDEIAAIEAALLTGLAHNLKAPGFRLDDADSKTIASGAITVTTGYVEVDTEGAAASDDLVTVTIGSMTSGPAIGEGSLLVLQPASAARVVTVKASGGNLSLIGGDYIMDSTASRLVLLYSGAAWVEVGRASNTQSAWATRAFSAGNFTAASGTWGVDSGDVTTDAYKLNGKTMVYSFQISGTDVTATPANLRILIPGGKTASKTMAALCYVRDASAAFVVGTVAAIAGDTKIYIARLDAANFTTTAADDTGVFGELTFEVQ